jgi:hypothetical protein
LKRIGAFNREKLGTAAWFLFWAVLSTAWCWSAVRAFGPTFDEPLYVSAGLADWRELTHRHLLTFGSMPLPAGVQTLPLRLAEWWRGSNFADCPIDWLPVARMTTACFWWLLLAAAYQLAALYGGTLGGRLAVALVACEPILLGHASLATTDIPLAACLVQLVAVYRRHREDPSWRRRVLLPAFWWSMTFLAKASAVLFVPVALAAIEFERLWTKGWRSGGDPQTWHPVLVSAKRDLVLIGLIGTLGLFVVCPQAYNGIMFQFFHNVGGHRLIFLLGQASPSGFWYYFPVALALKLGLPVFVLLGFMLLVRPFLLRNGALCVAVALLVVSPICRVQIGVRFVLAVAVFLLAGTAAAFACWWREQQTASWRILAGGLATLLVGWSLTNACLVWPYGTCFTNILGGGTRNGYLVLSDSNYDWGQGVHELRAWHQEHDPAPMMCWYFGNDPTVKAPPFQLVEPIKKGQGELERFCQGRYLAASTSRLYGDSFDTPLACYLRTLQPCGRTTMFLIYDFRTASKPPKS